jgi:WD40-like Beta Propeller Repeat
MKPYYLFLLSLMILFSFACKKNETYKTNELTKIYFAGYDPNIGTIGISWSEIYSINPDGTGLTQLTNLSNNGTKNIRSIEPCFNFDTTRLAFISNFGLYYPYLNLFSIKFDTTNLIQHSYSAGPSSSFHSPIGIKEFTQLELYLLVYEQSGHGEIVTDQAGSSGGLTLYTQYPIDGDCRDPFWIKPYLKFIYTSDKTGAREIYRVENYGNDKYQLTFNGLDKSAPKCSPAGDKIVFSSKLNTGAVNHSEVFIMNIDGTNMIQLTNYSNGGILQKITGSPVFAPDGQKIVYTSNESGSNQIYVMNVDGTENQKITSGNLKIFNPIAR